MKKVVIILMALLLIGILIFEVNTKSDNKKTEESKIVCTKPGKC